MKFSRHSLTYREKRKHTKRAIACILLLFAFLFVRVVFSGGGGGGTRKRQLNDEYGREPLYAFGTHHQHHQFLQKKSPGEYAMMTSSSAAGGRDHQRGTGIVARESASDGDGDASSHNNRYHEDEEEKEEQKQFSLANTKMYVYSSREIPEIAKLGGIGAAVTPDVFVLDAVADEREERSDALFRAGVSGVFEDAEEVGREND